MKKLIAIIGHGYVGKAVEYGFDNTLNKLQLIDPNLYGNSLDDIQDTFVSFICVPTPYGKNGHIDSSIVTDVTNKLIKNTTGLIVIKSTVIPSVIKELCCKSNRIIYNPEFLTERTALKDFINPSMHIFGGLKKETSILYKFFNSNSNCKPVKEVHFMGAVEAAFVKYGINSYLATKVIWFNQYKDLIENFGADFDIINKAIGSYPRIGYSHTQVPGHDGKRGFGGACFPKDTSAIVKFDLNFLSLLNLVITENNKYRSVYELEDREKEQNVTYE